VASAEARSDKPRWVVTEPKNFEPHGALGKTCGEPVRLSRMSEKGMYPEERHGGSERSLTGRSIERAAAKPRAAGTESQPKRFYRCRAEVPQKKRNVT
jgi:hypothetical protein